jgi:hypothetical protein
LTEASARLDVLNRKIVEIDASLAELGVRFNEAVRDLHLVVPPTAPPRP